VTLAACAGVVGAGVFFVLVQLQQQGGRGAAAVMGAFAAAS
jgi:hypothetical protein